MSRFSKAEAERLGWEFVHKQDEIVEDLGDGITRTTPAVLRAEKRIGTSLINETAETIGKLLERIHLYEKQPLALPGSPEPGPDPEAAKVIYDPTVPRGENPNKPAGGEEA
jgi:hypothetical protein